MSPAEFVGICTKGNGKKDFKVTMNQGNMME
jgi:hypothetical protein